MKKCIIVALISLFLCCPYRADAFTDGSGWVQVSYLIKLVEESIKHYYQLQTMIQQSRDGQNFLREINRGLDDSIRLSESLPVKDENVLGKLKDFQNAISEIEKVYGTIPKSKEAGVQKLNDLAIAESLKMVTNANDYAEKQETNATSIEARSWDMSPKGALRMQAQVSSQILLTLNQILRMNAQLLKMQSAQAANHNRQEKQDVLRFQRFASEVRSTSKSFSGDMVLPQF